jgi:hypothetical protein
MNADTFRRAYDAARAAGYRGTRSEFASLVLLTPQLFRGPVVAGARAWRVARGDLAPAPATAAVRSLSEARR